MSRASEADRLLALAQEMGEKVGGVLKDVVPPEAQRHLLNAQQELFKALFIIYQHQAGHLAPPAPRRRQRAAARPRVKRIELDDHPA